MRHALRLALFSLAVCLAVSELGSTQSAAEAGIDYSVVPASMEVPVPLPSTSALVAPQATTGTSYQTVKRENFEGSFPNCGGFPGACWTVTGDTTDPAGNPKQYLWDDNDWRPHPHPNCSSDCSYWAAWPAAGGSDAVDPESSSYLPNMNSWMFYGPLDLRAATSAQISFWLWRDIEPGYDTFWLGVWDGSQFLGTWSWDGYTDWEEEVTDLAPYVGRAGIWLAFGFQSNGSGEYRGPWVDDISFIVLPGEVTSRGSLKYANRSNAIDPAPSVNIYLYDWNQSSGTARWLASSFTWSDGSFSFPAVMNWDTDWGDPDPRLDLYLVWESDTSKDTEPRREVLDTNSDQVYAWPSGLHSNVPNGVGGNADFYNTLMAALSTNLKAMWLLQDMNRGREYVLSHTYPAAEPGSSRAYWTQGVDTYNYCQDGSCFVGGTNPYIFLRDGQMPSEDTPLHELGHHYMHTATNGWWYPWGDCWGHWYFTAKNTGCAWSEGWADFFALAVNNNPCYDLGTVNTGPCTGTANTDYFNMEAHNWQDNCGAFACGDAVEGRVAGALWDFLDSANDGYDAVNHGFAPIWSKMARQPGFGNFRQYWDAWTLDRHNSVQAVFQNSIDYDSAPYWNAPPLVVLRNHSLTIDVWSYVSDTDSQDSQLTFPGFANLNTQCAVGLASHILTFTPNWNYGGTCSARVDASDGIKTSGGTFNATVVDNAAYLPLISNQP